MASGRRPARIEDGTALTAISYVWPSGCAWDAAGRLRLDLGAVVASLVPRVGERGVVDAMHQACSTSGRCRAPRPATGRAWTSWMCARSKSDMIGSSPAGLPGSGGAALVQRLNRLQGHRPAIISPSGRFRAMHAERGTKAAAVARGRIVRG